jgi:nitrite reductase (NADH) small subunit
MSLVYIGDVQDFNNGVIRVVSVKQREVGVLLWEGTWYAMRNICPHLGGPICAGLVNGFLTAEGTPWEGGDLIADHSRPVVTCPWHRWEYDLRTGDGLGGTGRIRMHTVHIENGGVFIELDRPETRIVTDAATTA